jgi:hypothetical protein
MEHDYVRFDCFLISEPEAELTWYHNEILVSSNDRQITVNKDDQCSLIINECELEDFGDYKIIARNSFGEAQSQCRLNVQLVAQKQTVQLVEEQQSFEVLEGPDFEEKLSDINIIEGYDACFKCKVSSKAPYDVKWFKDGKKIEETNKFKVSYRIF